MYVTGKTANVGGINYVNQVIRSINIIPFKDLGTMKQITTPCIIYLFYCLIVLMYVNNENIFI